MAQRGSDLEVFAGLCAGLVTTLLVWVAVAALSRVVPLGPDLESAGRALAVAGGVAGALTVHRLLRARARRGGRPDDGR
ncbi:hypothetical protein GCM10009665_10010 [Kitasatospora nipponensis]|uniref:Secreted protein with PEP-CTERM sorting signal n=1 Tax=Kitasatospora nipponensis TaxID=258049 RepID=A0ABN1VWF8_9ACTN